MHAYVPAVGKPLERPCLMDWVAMTSLNGPSARDSAGDGQPKAQFLTVAEVASLMRVSKMTVYRLVHSGELPAVRVGRSFRVSEKDVNDYLKGSFFQTG